MLPTSDAAAADHHHHHLLSPSCSYSFFFSPDEAEEVLLSPNARFVVASECTLEVLLLLLPDIDACHSSL